MTATPYYYAFCDRWHGVICAVHGYRSPAPFARWLRVSRREYLDLRREGFRVRTAGKETTRRAVS